MHTLETRPTIAMKGMLIGTEVVGKYLYLWYSSPDGGQTDSQIFQMRCSGEQQAKTIESQHRKVWSL